MSLMGIFNEWLDSKNESQTVNRGKALLNSLSRGLVDKLDHRALHKGGPA